MTRVFAKSAIPEHLQQFFVPAEYGLESSPAEYVDTMRAVFAEVRRVLADDGTTWINIGDSYSGTGETGRKDAQEIGRDGLPQYGSFVQPERRSRRLRVDYGLPAKNLLGIPWRVVFALQDDGWILRSDVIWHKENAMPESVQDRPAKTYEHVFLLSPGPRYYFDLDAIREPHSPNKPWGRDTGTKPGQAVGALRGHPAEWYQRGLHTNREHPGGRNPGDVWTIPTQPFPAAHFAVMAPELARRCVVAGCKPGGVVLDPFCGVGTTGMVAGQNGRRFVGIDLSAKTLDLALRTRLRQGVLIEESA
jgi:site-specific DNA-methyltransferase (cytosine-N4-specific)